MQTDDPVWTVEPNWQNGILERLEWLTDILASDSGVEQRRSVRLSPRRSFEITFNPSQQERAYLDLAMHRLGSVPWLMPLWHDQAFMQAGIAIGGTRITIDNRWREFLNGGFALIYVDAFTWEVVQVLTQDDTGLNLSAGTAGAWPVNTRIFPLRRMTVAIETSISALTSRVGESILLWTVADSNDFAEVMPGGVSFLGAPVLSVEPDRSQSIKLDQVRLAYELDNQIGVRYRVDSAGRAFEVQAHSWQVYGRQDRYNFRTMLYWLRGRQRMVWLPTFNDDLSVSRSVAIGDTMISIKKIGLGYIGGNSAIPGRSRFWTGSEVLLQNAMLSAPSAQEERLSLTTATVQAYAVGASWSFLEPARLNQDNLELHHYADSDGLMECSATFHTFANDRTADLPIYVPIPTAAKSSTVCGSTTPDGTSAYGGNPPTTSTPTTPTGYGQYGGSSSGGSYGGGTGNGGAANGYNLV